MRVALRSLCLGLALGWASATLSCVVQKHADAYGPAGKGNMNRPSTDAKVALSRDDDRQAMASTANAAAIAKDIQEDKKKARAEDYAKWHRKLEEQRIQLEDDRKKRKLEHEHRLAGAEDKKQHEAKKGNPVGTVALRIRGPSAVEPLMVTVSQDQHLGSVAEQAARHYKIVDRKKLRLLYQGKVVKRGDTVAMHGFQSGSTLDIVLAD
mmetsp:Transcript_111419/g.296066  ORF Transcript_111419/g.296066 Transcript_111419/m.296066 type:complete len:209 (-) Transcript_111419:78-704(-)|eukprot:CAMPEP_0171240920 /NCGR_PEP_ID=MMETSP0790-20130122/44799_1 /TAXON_ID=2925 /ORGANISM="Alexandrium catenella, Strain OF101" /LENGTH=208 /DNA_ID=CAMNT_0011707455 /DNA_START=70 /DNA_END=696 /DNA_ORIENTATION=+